MEMNFRPETYAGSDKLNLSMLVNPKLVGLRSRMVCFLFIQNIEMF